MKYMILVYSPENAWNAQEWTQCTQDSAAVCQELQAKGELLSASPLHPVHTAVSVRVREGKTLVTHGPFAETVEQLGGYFLVDVPDIDKAISIASRLPAASKGTIELRPLFPLEGLPASRFELLQQNQPDQGVPFMFLCYDDEAAWTQAGPEALRDAMQEAAQLTQSLNDQSKYICAAPLHPTSMATSVRIRENRKMITDGPFAETREFLGGFYLVLAKNLTEAVAIASQHSGARLGTVEVRRMFVLPQMIGKDPCEIESERTFSFTPEQIRFAFSDPVRLARWWGPTGFQNTFHEFEFREGGPWRFTMHGPDGKDYLNESFFRQISDSQIVIEHISAPKFSLTITTLASAPNKSIVKWQMRFATPHLRNEIAKFAVPANEENFDRL